MASAAVSASTSAAVSWDGGLRIDRDGPATLGFLGKPPVLRVEPGDLLGDAVEELVDLLLVVAPERLVGHPELLLLDLDGRQSHRRVGRGGLGWIGLLLP